MNENVKKIIEYYETKKKYLGYIFEMYPITGIITESNREYLENCYEEELYVIEEALRELSSTCDVIINGLKDGKSVDEVRVLAGGPDDEEDFVFYPEELTFSLVDTLMYSSYINELVKAITAVYGATFEPELLLMESINKAFPDGTATAQRWVGYFILWLKYLEAKCDILLSATRAMYVFIGLNDPTLHMKVARIRRDLEYIRKLFLTEDASNPKKVLYENLATVKLIYRYHKSLVERDDNNIKENDPAGILSSILGFMNIASKYETIDSLKKMTLGTLLSYVEYWIDEMGADYPIMNTEYVDRFRVVLEAQINSMYHVKEENPILLGICEQTLRITALSASQVGKFLSWHPDTRNIQPTGESVNVVDQMFKELEPIFTYLK